MAIHGIPERRLPSLTILRKSIAKGRISTRTSKYTTEGEIQQIRNGSLQDSISPRSPNFRQSICELEVIENSPEISSGRSASLLQGAGGTEVRGSKPQSTSVIGQEVSTPESNVERNLKLLGTYAHLARRQSHSLFSASPSGAIYPTDASNADINLQP